MPLSRRVAEWNRAGLNKPMRRAAPWIPGLAVVIHRGRRSGTEYRTPVNVFRTRDGFTFALTYGSGADWVRNVLAAGEAELLTRGQTKRLYAPRLYTDQDNHALPTPFRQLLKRGGIVEFLEMRERPS